MTHLSNLRLLRLGTSTSSMCTSHQVTAVLKATHGWYSKLVVGTTFSRYCADYAGFGCQNVFRSGWQCWCIAAFTALHLATWPQIFSACHTSTHIDDCALRLHQRWSFHALCVLPLVDRTFPATAASLWNSLPELVQSSQLLQVFRSRLKTELFARSYRHD